MKADLHVHSKFSKRPSQWILQKISCPESFTEPLHIYKVAKERGMSLVTITDHNNIEGSLAIAHLKDTFVSEEVTTYFPEDGCKIHVLVYNIDESIHSDIQKVRDNIFDLVAYLNQRKVTHAVAHPFYSSNDRLTIEHFEQILLLFRNFEFNGARDPLQNEVLEHILSRLTALDIFKLSETYGIEPLYAKPWAKGIIGGSDDHSSLCIARKYTTAEDARNQEEFLLAIAKGKTKAEGLASSPQILAHNLYSIAYQYYKSRFNLEKMAHRDILLLFLDRLLQGNREGSGSRWLKVSYLWNHRESFKFKKGPPPNTIKDLIIQESQRLIMNNPELMQIVKNGGSDSLDNEKTWFRFVNEVSNKVLIQFGNNLLNHLSGGNFFNIFNSIGSAGALYSILAPYFVSFSLFTKDRRLARNVLERFVSRRKREGRKEEKLNIACFTDTFFDVNGVAITLQQQLELAHKTGKDLTVITCNAEEMPNREGVRNFNPVGVYEIPEYPEFKLFYPPFLEILNFCYEKGFTHIHSATPGSMGLAALAVSSILKLPVYGTYHTSLPQYAQYLTGDSEMEDLMWKYVLWYYSQMEMVFVPSKSTGKELEERGISPERICVYPRGVDVERFHPSKRNAPFGVSRAINTGIRILYVGRVSKEKNLQLLTKAVKALLRVTESIYLVIVGDGPYLKEMKEELRGAPVLFTGYMNGEDLPVMYASCDLFVFPSSTDTFGNVVLEAQASGLPVIVTDAGGPQENLIHGKTGLVIPANDENALIEAIHSFVHNPQKLKTMGENARRFVKDRCYKNAFELTWRIYEGKEKEPAIAASLM